MTTDIASVSEPLGLLVMALLAYGNDVLFIQEEIEIALVILLVVSHWSVVCVALAYEVLATSRPLACPVIPIQYPAS
ncbi:hypothetical protein BRY73_02880 [Ochrobactrum sp. P6BS-III]|nr:hypothetical protein [Ochrobactrum sp. P6BSIII]OOL20122.1 hypothetical protein BRY73_02880 [Ochrobactrum sp. P6BS-III]